MGDTSLSGANMGSTAALFLRVLDAVPLVLDNLDEDALKATARTCWSALLATLRHGRLRDHERHLVPVRIVTPHGPLLAGLAARVSRGSQYGGLLQFSGAGFPVGDAAALREASRHAGVEDTDYDTSTPESRLRALVKMLGASETSGQGTLRAVKLYYQHHHPLLDDICPLWRHRHRLLHLSTSEREQLQAPWLRLEEERASLLYSLLHSAPVVDHLERLHLCIIDSFPFNRDGYLRRSQMVARMMNAAKCSKSLRVLVLHVGSIDLEACFAIADLVRCSKNATSGGVEELCLWAELSAAYETGACAIVKACTEGSVRHLTMSVLHYVAADCRYDAVAASLADTELGAFARPNQLAVLDLSRSNLGPSWTAAVAALVESSSTLTKLDLWRADLDSHRAQALCDAIVANAALPLRDLNMGSNNIGDEGAAAVGEMLARNTSLATLRLNRADIGDRGYEHVARGLTLNSTLRHLDLSKSSKYMQSAGVVALAEAVAKSTSLSSLKIGGFEACLEDTRATGKAIGEMLGCNSSLRALKLVLDLPDEGAWRSVFQGLARNRALRKLDIDGNAYKHCYVDEERDTYLDDDDAAALASALESNHVLCELRMVQGDIGTAGAAALARALRDNCGLRHLDLDSIRIGREEALQFAEAVGIHRSLRRLNLSGAYILPNYGGEAFRCSARVYPGPGGNAIELETEEAEMEVSVWPDFL